jgi:mannose-6-phosphate isomerase-like protein (cupin superfamily)
MGAVVVDVWGARERCDMGDCGCSLEVREGMVIVHDLDSDSVAQMFQVDLADLDSEPESPIANFSFHGCTGGVAAFRGRPPWEFHGGGDELLFVLSGRSELTVLEDGNRSVRTLSPGQLVIVPKGHWHSNDAPGGVTMLWITPNEGNEHSWDEPST